MGYNQNYGDLISQEYSPQAHSDEINGGSLSSVKMPKQGMFASLASAQPGGPPGGPQPGGPMQGGQNSEVLKGVNTFMGKLMNMYNVGRRFGV
jgi:hypothetical protein